DAAPHAVAPARHASIADERARVSLCDRDPRRAGCGRLALRFRERAFFAPALHLARFQPRTDQEPAGLDLDGVAHAFHRRGRPLVVLLLVAPRFAAAPTLHGAVAEQRAR